MLNLSYTDISFTIVVISVLSFFSLSFYLEKLYTIIMFGKKNGEALNTIAEAVFRRGEGARCVKDLFAELISEKNVPLTKSPAGLIFNYDIEADLTAEKIKVSISKLGSIAVLAPYIGLFGTVMGVIEAFAAIARSGSSNFAFVSRGISEALVATAAGLLLAIMASFFYNHLTSRLKLIQTHKDCFIERLNNELRESGVK
ncbi:MAG: Biopolymer transport protein ExbB [bacterium ADurb.Bin243]|nr:MAG: Biopolymer transport protein ExbB [bacterium ADurb.Bin243]